MCKTRECALGWLHYSTTLGNDKILTPIPFAKLKNVSLNVTKPLTDLALM